MSDETGPRRTSVTDTITGVLADGLRRRLLDVLRGRNRPVGERDLAARLATDGGGGSPEGTGDGPASEERVRELRIALRHVHLPSLADAGLVEWDRAGATVAVADDPPVDDATLARFVETDTEG